MDHHTTHSPPPVRLTTDAVFGAPCWVSLMTHDLHAAQQFYGPVLDWEFRSTQLGDAFTVALQQGTPVAGMGGLAQSLQVAVAWTPYFAVRDADRTAARIRERSGTTAVGPLAFVVGRGALAADRDGAVFGIWEGLLLEGWEAWRDHAPSWTELRTRDAFDSAIFYGEVLEWAADGPGGCDVDYADEAVVLRSGGHVIARLSSGAADSAPDPLVRPRWQVHFSVPDVARSVAAARERGGTVTRYASTPTGPEVTLRDPQGGLFTVNAGHPGHAGG
jgi:predicted enzyme related to lactoylglutathione lyase